MQVLGSTARVTFEVKLWEDGRIDLLYGSNPANPGDGRNAGIGIENAAGTDALQFSFLEGLLDPNTAFRIRRVPSGLVHGAVTDANDGLPIAGATSPPTPGGRRRPPTPTAPTALRLRPGTLHADARAPRTTSPRPSATVVDGGEPTRDFALDAAIAAVDPTEVSADGRLRRDDRRRRSRCPTAAPRRSPGRPGSATRASPARPAAGADRRDPQGDAGAASQSPAGVPAVVISDTTPGPASARPDTIITDPAGDSLDSVDVIDGPGRLRRHERRLDGDRLRRRRRRWPRRRLRLPRHRPGSVDRPPGRGPLRPADAGHRHGVLRRPVRLANSDGIVLDLRRRDVRPRRRVVPATIDGHTILFDIPLEALGGDDGYINTAMVARRLRPRRTGRPTWATARSSRSATSPWLSEWTRVTARSRRRPGRDDPPRRPRTSRPATTTRSSSSSRTRRSRRSCRST